METNKKIKLYGIAAGVCPLFLFFIIAGLTDFSSVGVTIGVMASVALFIYLLVKAVKIELQNNPQQTIITQNITYFDETSPDWHTIINKMPKTPIFLGPNEDFMYAGMYETVCAYFKKVLDAKAEHGMIDVCYSLSGIKSGKHVVMQFMEDANLAEGEPFDIGIYFYPDNYTPDYAERFKKNFYWQSCFKDSSTPEENTYIAYFSEDIDTAVHVASYVLATVYNIPLDTIFTYKFDNIG